uniref:Uncharacterized protein n=1 Tax=Mesocestoides corti TaxID=53468 RepID=A0A5K3FJC8_MESCO
MEPGNYLNAHINENVNLDNSRILSGTSRLGTEPSRRDVIKRSEYRKFLKIRTIVFGSLAAGFLTVGLTLIFVFQNTKTSRELWVVGLLSSILGGVCAFIFVIYLPVFMRVMASRSETVAYQSRPADALKNSTYPRQVDVDIVARPPATESSCPPTATNPHYHTATDPHIRHEIPSVLPSAPMPPLPPTEDPPRYDYIQREQHYF